MHIWIPELEALTCAENANHSLHNIQTLRGARTRDARNFARYLDETLERWGDEAEVHYGPHTWPVWGNENIVAFLESQRDTYKYIHDQALRQANKGYTPLEAAEVIELPEALGRKWYNRGYHGTLHHDVRAVYTKELGCGTAIRSRCIHIRRWSRATRYVELIGAEQDSRRGQAGVRGRGLPLGGGDPAQAGVRPAGARRGAQPAGRRLRADGVSSRGAAVARDLLTAARELRDGVQSAAFVTASQDTILAMPIDILFDFVAVHSTERRPPTSTCASTSPSPTTTRRGRCGCATGC